MDVETKDALSNNYTVISENCRIEHFSSVYDLTKAGWTLDWIIQKEKRIFYYDITCHSEHAIL